MIPIRPGDDARIPLIRSVTYVRALFPWELRHVRGANDDQFVQPTRHEDAPALLIEGRRQPSSRPEV